MVFKYDSWLLVGAPKANFTSDSDIPTPGNVYKCRVNLSTKEQEKCEEIPGLRTGETTRRRSEHSYEEENQLLGANMLVTQFKVLVCSSLWKNVFYEFTDKKVFAIGYCYELTKSNLTAVKEVRFKEMEEKSQLITNEGLKFGMAQVGFSTAAMDEEGLFLEIPTKLENLHTSTIGLKMISFLRMAQNLAHLLTGSGFGSTICVADINGDGKDDLLIGAPLSTFGIGKDNLYECGKVFVYYGTGDISSAFDIDENQYGDFAVGAYMSDTVILLRTRPIVNMTATMTIMPDVIPLNSSGLNCSVDPTKPCAQIQLCFKFEGLGVDDGILIDFDVKADTRRTEARKTSRIQLFIGEEKHTDEATKINFKVTKGEKTCTTIDGRVQTISREFYGAISEDLKIIAEFRLSNESLPGRVFPILNEQFSRTVEKSAYFEKECVEKCRSNLNLEMSVVGLSKEIVVGETQEVAVRITVKNRNQPSYATSVLIQISNNTEYLGSQIFEGSRAVTCILHENQTNSVGNDVVECDVDRPLYQHHVVDFLVRLNVSLGALVPCEQCFDNMLSTVHVIANVDTQGSIEEDPSDNRKTVSLPIKFETILEVNGISKPEQHKLSSENKDDYFEFSHEYFVYNTGPSPLPTTRIILDIPVKGDSAEKLTEKNQISVESSLEDSECKLLSFIDGVPIEQSTTSTVSSSLLVSTASSTINSRTVPTAKPQKRKKRETQPLTDQTKIQTITNINDVLLRYKTKGEVEQPAHKLFYPWNRGLYYQAYIDFFPEKVVTPSTKINIWIIIGGCLGGVALIIILGIILWRCGFFKRKQPKEFRDWKRQSMRNRRSVRSSSSKSTKSTYEPQEVAKLTRSSENLNGR
ncbi:hypothetical protein KUTeg_008076 [Tegillarca granosa]|uniref:Uncharacterized protein n=1 Tax=Tegillarca granosa TaxID=220873 RepID=A0ABQ9FCY4_TEGGR|nr:hypothetical protein KUTeg_008076 [Tegillarca granosa]